MALGFKLPEVKFLSISLHGGSEQQSQKDNPHIDDGSYALEFASLEAFGNNSSEYSSENPEQQPEVMNVDVILGVKVGFDVTSKNIYTYFFENDFSKYLKIVIAQSTSQEATGWLINHQDKTKEDYLALQNYNANSGFTKQTKQFTEFDGTVPEKAEDFASSIEVKYDKDGNKNYIFPYKFTFQVPVVEGGTKTNHLAYFVSAYIDIEAISVDESALNEIELPQSIINELSSGNISFQQVIQGGTVNNSSQVFYINNQDSSGFPLPLDENSQLWVGDVHYHGNQNPGPNGYIGYMGGTGNTPQDMGPFLTPVSIQNNIIQDFRALTGISQIIFDYSYFSNSWFNQTTTEKFQNNINGIKALASQDNPYKIDSDDIELAVIKSLSNSSNKSIFGNFYSAMDGSGNTRFIFGFNIKEAIKQNTIFPKLVDSIYDSNAGSLYNYTTIKELKVYRHRVYEENPADLTVDIYEEVLNESPKLVVVSSENMSNLSQKGIQAKQEYSSELKKIVGTIKELDLYLPLNFNPDVGAPYRQNQRFFTGVDLQTPIDGDYIFSVEMTISDPIIPWMKERIDSLEEILYGNTDPEYKGFKEYYSFSKQNPEYFNRYTNRFTQKGIEEINGQFPKITYYITNQLYEKVPVEKEYNKKRIDDFFNIISEFSNFNYWYYTQSAGYLKAFLNKISSVNYGNPSGVETTFRVMEDIYSKVLNIFSSASKYKKPIDSQHVESQYAAGSNPRRDFVLKHKFNTEIKGEIDHLTGYDYLSLNNTKNEDTPIADGLKNLSYGQWEFRINKETDKLFPTKPADTDNLLGDSNEKTEMTIYQYPLSEVDNAAATVASGFSLAEAEELGIDININLDQGQILNPDDSYNFTKNAYLSPSIVNFSNADSQNLLNDGQLVTDIRKLNNTMLNILKYNYGNQAGFDFPYGQVSDATDSIIGKAQGDTIIQPSPDNELKYDLSSIMNSRQSTVYSAEYIGALGGGLTVNNGNTDLYSELFEVPDQSVNYDQVDPFLSSINPSKALLTTTEQSCFDFLSDPTWTWEYYVDNTNTVTDFPTFYKEYYDWKTGVDSGFYDEPYTSENSPLKRAPNHIKALVLHLDWTKTLAPPAFSSLLSHLQTTKPYAYDYSPSSLIIGSSPGDYLGVKSTAYDINGTTSYNQVYAKNKILYQTPEFLSFFLLNYKNIVKIECFLGYDNEDMNNPIWNELTLEMVEVLKNANMAEISGLPGQFGKLVYANSQTLMASEVLCRMVPYEKHLYGVKRYNFMNLPIYNEHFIIRFGDQETVSEASTANPRDISTTVGVRGRNIEIFSNPVSTRGDNSDNNQITSGRVNIDTGTSAEDQDQSMPVLQVVDSVSGGQNFDGLLGGYDMVSDGSDREEPAGTLAGGSTSYVPTTSGNNNYNT